MQCYISRQTFYLEHVKIVQSGYEDPHKPSDILVRKFQLDAALEEEIYATDRRFYRSEKANKLRRIYGWTIMEMYTRVYEI